MLVLLLALAWLGGNAIAAFGLPAYLGPLVGFIGIWRDPASTKTARALTILLLGATAVGGHWSYMARRPEAGPNDISRYIDSGPTRVRGIINGDRDLRGNVVVLHMDVTSLEDDRGIHEASGSLLLRLSAAVPYVDGDLLEVRGKPALPPQGTNFDYRAYLAQQGIYAEIDYGQSKLLAHDRGPLVRRAISRLRIKLDEGLTSVLPEPEASLGAGMLLGTRHVREPALSSALNSTDAAMIAIATGYNVTVVALFVLSAASTWIGRRKAALLALMATLAYAALLGAYPSILRASVMSSIVMLAALAGRPSGAGRALLVACAVMTAIDPQALRSLAFPLSLAATAGVIWLSEPLAVRIYVTLRGPGAAPDPGEWRWRVCESLGVTLAALGSSLPVVVAASHVLSLSAFPANVLLFPLVPPIMLASAAAAIAGAIVHPLGLVFAPVAYLLLWLMVAIVRMCAALPLATLGVPWFGAIDAAIAGALILGAVWAHRSGVLNRAIRISLRLLPTLGHPQRQRPPDSAGADSSKHAGGSLTSGSWLVAFTISGALLAGVILGFVGSATFATRREKLRVTYLDVGTGSSILLEAGGQRVLIDSGPPGEATTAALDRTLAPWQRSLSVVILTEDRPDHMGGLQAVLSRYRVGTVLDGSVVSDIVASGAAPRNIVADSLHTNMVQTVPLAGDAVLRIGSALVRVSPFRPPFTGAPAEAATVTASIGHRRFVLAGDSDTAITGDVRSVGAANLSAPPSPARIEVLESGQRNPADRSLESMPLSLRRALVYRTIENGDIAIISDGGDLRVQMTKGPRLGLFGPGR